MGPKMVHYGAPLADPALRAGFLILSGHDIVDLNDKTVLA